MKTDPWCIGGAVSLGLLLAWGLVATSVLVYQAILHGGGAPGAPCTAELKVLSGVIASGVLLLGPILAPFLILLRRAATPPDAARYGALLDREGQ